MAGKKAEQKRADIHFDKSRKLIISREKYTGETAVTSVRLPKTMIAALENVSEYTGWTRNEVITVCLAYALEQVEK